jgi:hypothetical protein
VKTTSTTASIKGALNILARAFSKIGRYGWELNKPLIRKHKGSWFYVTYKDTLKYLIDKSISFDELDNSFEHKIGHGVTPEKAYLDWRDK